MKTPVVILMLFSCPVFAQRGDITIPTSAEITVPASAQLCADHYYANNPGFGTLNYGNDPTRLCGAVIPVEFLSLSASYNNGSVTMLWRTISETNCAGYEVQRSADRAPRGSRLDSFPAMARPRRNSPASMTMSCLLFSAGKERCSTASSRSTTTAQRTSGRSWR